MKTRKSILYSIGALLFMLGLILGSVVGGLLNVLSPTKIGFWNQETLNTDLRITLLRHTISSPTQIRTTITLNNISPYQIKANVTLFYENQTETNLATYSYNVTINTGASNSRTFTVNLAVAQWVTTDISIEEILKQKNATRTDSNPAEPFHVQF